MLQPLDESLGDGSSTLSAHTENPSEDPSVDSEQTSDHSTSRYLVQVQLSHKQINKRFTELLNLFEGYTKIMDGGDQKQLGVASNQLKLSASHEQNDRLSSVGTASERTLQAASCEVSIQTSWTLLEAQQQQQQQKNSCDSKAMEEEKPSRRQQHTIHIEVESVTSATEMRRAPLHHRLWHVIINAMDAFLGCLFMMGENFPYMLFILLCIWCLYLLLAHYRKFLINHIVAVELPS